MPFEGFRVHGRPSKVSSPGSAFQPFSENSFLEQTPAVSSVLDFFLWSKPGGEAFSDELMVWVSCIPGAPVLLGSCFDLLFVESHRDQSDKQDTRQHSLCGLTF